MKTIYNILTLLCVLFLVACQAEDDLTTKSTGYLSLKIVANNSTTTKAADEEPYNPKQLAVQILNESGIVIEETDDYTEWNNKKFELPVGKYTVKAASNGFDGLSAAWDKPYYAGSSDVTVVSGLDVTANVTCTLANVLVTVNFDTKFKEGFKSATIVVADSADMNGTRLTFQMGENETAKAYFPVPEKSLIVQTSVTNQKDKTYSKNDTVREVKARDNVKLNYKVSDSSEGSTSIDIQLDGSIKTYNFTIGVPVTAKTTLSISANPWASFVYLEGKILSKVGNIDKSKLALEYKLASAEEWTSVAELTEGAEDSYSAKVTGLTPATEYQCRFVYKDTEEVSSEVIEFATEAATPLQNGNFDAWCDIDIKGLLGNVKTAYPNASADIKFWDTSNSGANSMSSENPTKGVTDPVHTSGGKAAELQSKKVVIAFAAASLYTGTFGEVNMGTMSATLNFGQPFTSRPIELKGFYRYIPVAIDNVGKNLPSNTVQKGDPDQCSIYIALAKKSFLIDNNDPNTFINFKEDPDIIAYGELPSGVATEGLDYVEFSIPIKYKNLTEKPTHIIIVCSASKYGDYMTGGAGSKLYVDDFSLIYDGEPVLWK